MDLSGLLLAVLDVAVLLSFLGTGLHLNLADLLWLAMAVLLLDWESENIGELIVVPVHVSLAHLLLDLSRGVVTGLDWLPVIHHTLFALHIIVLVVDLSGLLFAVLDVAVFLSFLGTILHLNLASLLRLELAILLLDWEGENIGDLLVTPVYVSFVRLDLGLSRDIVTVLGWLLDPYVRA